MAAEEQTTREEYGDESLVGKVRGSYNSLVSLYDEHINPWSRTHPSERKGISEKQVQELLSSGGQVKQKIPIRAWDPEINGSMEVYTPAHAHETLEEFNQLSEEYSIESLEVAVYADEDKPYYKITFLVDHGEERTFCAVKQRIKDVGPYSHVKNYLESEELL